MVLKRGDVRGQLTIFIIVAVVLIASIGLFFFIRQDFQQSQIPTSLEPIYTTFLSCLEEGTLIGIDILESQAGYIEIPAFEPGSDFMPFSSQLGFLGNPIPYWYYVSGNNIHREQIPMKNEMGGQLANFVEQKIKNCALDSYRKNGFEIFLDSGEATVAILDDRVDVS